MHKLTVILPAAGKGSRLSISHSKEILKADGKSLIDYSFDLFSNQALGEIHFIIIINETKLDIVTHLARYNGRHNISFIFQKPNLPEYTGAIQSAEHLLGEHNLVLLPDTIIELVEKTSITENTLNALMKDDFVFFYKRETDNDILKSRGALHLSRNGRVTDYEDKPSSNIERFNAYWGAFGFNRKVFKDTISTYLHNTTNKLPNVNFDTTILHMSPGIELKSYADLGTWTEYNKFISGIQ